MKSPVSPILALLVYLLYAAASAHSVTPQHSIPITEASDWIIHQSVQIPDDLPIDDISSGVYHLLTDEQIDASASHDSEYFFHYAELVVNQAGLERSSQINISFDPSYESLALHRVQIIRDGKAIDKLATTDISVLQREQEMKNLIYNGRLTANLILDDVRVGDVVEYSFTLKGDNPVYSGIFAYESSIEYSVPVHRQFLRVRWRKSNPLNIKVLNSSANVEKSVSQGGTEYTIEILDSSPRYKNTQVPPWYDPYGKLIFSELNTWAEVVAWAEPLYSDAYDNSREVKEIAADLRFNNPAIEDQIVGALQFVQREVRYLGIEMGVNSHMPTVAGETLRRRYGDCKDKAVLMISLLNELGIKSYPVLVNTQSTKKIVEYPPEVGAFNHVLVRVLYGGKTFWLDPTRRYQQGSLSEIYQPDYGFALVIEPETNSLITMAADEIRTGLLVVDKFDLSSGGGKEVIYESSSEYYGASADLQRSYLESDGLSEKQNSYTEFYKGYYPSLEPIEKLYIESSNNSGVFRFSEKYIINSFWEVDSSTNDYKANFYANAISPEILKPKEINRKDPFSIRYPNKIKQTIEVNLPSKDWEFKESEFIESNKYFNYRNAVKHDNNAKKLTLTYEYNALTDSVPAEELNAYLESRSRAIANAEFGIVQYFDGEGATDITDNLITEFNIIVSVFILFVAGLLFVIVNWRLDARKKPDCVGIAFYPVSLTKLIALSVITVGIYPMYWFYRNWQYVKRKEANSLMPIARGLFNYLWYYPLYKRLVADSDERYKKNQLPGTFVAILMAAAYFVLTMVANIGSATLFAFIASLLLLLPLANYINHIQQPDEEAYRYNSRWLLRHTVMSILFIPLLVLLYGGQFNLLPNQEVVEGNDIWGHDIKYMQRKGVIPAGEDIVLFYSDAWLSVRNDGNGFTENRVFSYWLDDNDSFNYKSEPLANVSKINPHYSTKWDEDSTVTIILDDESEFVLYLPSESNMDRKFVKLLRDKWVRARAKSGNTSAQYQMNLKERAASVSLGKSAFSNEWLARAAESGHVKAQYELAMSLLAGIDGETDQARALELIFTSAKQNHTESQLLLGELYSKGMLVEQSHSEAISWYSRAYDLDNKEAGRYLAWHLSTIPDGGLRDGEAAVEIAERLVRDDKKSSSLETLAAAFAEAGDFESSVEAQNKAIELTEKKSNAIALTRLAKYQAAEPLRTVWKSGQENTIGYASLLKVAPIYPKKANRKGIEGYAIVEYDVGSDGRVTNVKVIDTDQAGHFEEASIAASKRFIYFPKLVDGIPVAVSGIKNRFTFELEK